MLTFQNLEIYQKKVDDFLDSFFRIKIAASTPALENLLKVAHEFALQGGKRLRPILLIAGYQATGSGEDENILPAAVAMELLHVALLIQDDIMDRDRLRRGRPTVHYAYMDTVDDRHIAEALAMTVSDVLIGYSQELLLQIPATSARNTIQAARILARTLQEVAQGQLLDIVYSNSFEGLTERDLFRVIELKTSSYSVTAPLKIGALLGGGTEKLIQSLKLFSRPLGIAFQLQDDVMGLIGDSVNTGKSTGADIKEGKYTLIMHEGLYRAGDIQLQHLMQSFGNAEASPEEVNVAIQILSEVGAIQYVARKADAYFAEAEALLPDLPIPQPSRIFLRNLIIYLRQRQN